MNALIAEWIEKADGDYFTAQREFRARKNPNYDAVCFHCQQSVEKYLKAFLQEHAVVFPKTHSLIELLELCLPVDTTFELQRDLMIKLERYAVHYRYPGQSADKDEARAALNALKLLRRVVRDRLGLLENSTLT